MSDLAGYYDTSYPPSVWDGSTVDPDITSLTPNAAVAGSGLLAVTVTGMGFQSTSVVEADGTALATVFVSSTELTTGYNPLVEGPHVFTVRNSSGKESNDAPFTVTAS